MFIWHSGFVEPDMQLRFGIGVNLGQRGSVDPIKHLIGAGVVLG